MIPMRMSISSILRPWTAALDGVIALIVPGDQARRDDLSDLRTIAQGSTHVIRGLYQHVRYGTGQPDATRQVGVAPAGLICPSRFAKLRVCAAEP